MMKSLTTAAMLESASNASSAARPELASRTTSPPCSKILRSALLMGCSSSTRSTVATGLAPRGSSQTCRTSKHGPAAPRDKYVAGRAGPDAGKPLGSGQRLTPALPVIVQDGAHTDGVHIRTGSAPHIEQRAGGRSGHRTPGGAVEVKNHPLIVRSAYHKYI